MTLTPASERQIRASSPVASTWLSANAGSGKTRVLTDRVARLLLGGVEPQHILCLTYTKAAASEMQNRLFRRLGEWAMKPDADLRGALAELGEEGALTADRLSRARQLFARAIETPGGLRIQTIHSFCATLLRRFPLEAGVSPQFTELDDRAARLLRDDIVEELAESGAPDVIADLARAWTGEDFGTLMQQVVGRRAHFATPLGMDDCRRLFGLHQGDTAHSLLAGVLLGDETTWMPGVIAALTAKGGNDGKAGAKLAQLNLSQPTLHTLSGLEAVCLYGTGEKAGQVKIGAFPTKPTQAALGPALDKLNNLMSRVESARATRIALQAAERTATLHRFAAVFLPLYEQRKAQRGWLDFDDLITKARMVLTDASVAAWVLFRLDGGIDHILVDEAQDTSPEQWRVIESLAAEFTAGSSARDTERTLFVVGDKKQSIYSFQGADVAAFDAKQDSFRTRFETVGRQFQSLSLEHSFRSSPAILRLVDQTFGDRFPDAMGGAVSHIAFKDRMPGRVDLWPMVPKSDSAPEDDWEDPVDLITDTHHAARLARDIAGEIRGMIDAGVCIPTDDGPRPMHAGDVLILVQRRSALFSEVIRACKAAGLPIAGADRLKLGAEMAVKDMAALLSFLATPEDDLSLAAVLRSPLCGWSEGQLYDLAQPRKGYLWRALQDHAADHPATHDMLKDLRDQADFLRPFDLIERALTRHEGRRRLLARLGPEAEDGIDELLSQALAYERLEVPSLTGFLIWLETDDVEVKRQMDSEGHRIRVMTVHGAKGLEAPVVILPDTADRNPQDRDEVYDVDGAAIWRTPADESPAAVTAARAARKAKADAENLRLLYVALTRARSWLIVAGAGEATKDNSWYQLVAQGMQAAGAMPSERGRQRLSFGDWPGPQPLPVVVPIATDLPIWARTPAPVAPRDVVLLSPSDLGGPKALPGDGLDEAAAKARGTLLHLMLEQLPTAPQADWPLLAEALVEDAILRQDLLAEATVVLTDPALAHLFAPGTLAEVPITAALGSGLIYGTIDRLIITPTHVLAVDFKSNRVVPATPDQTPDGILRQMAAYADALRQIYPGRVIETAILWTAIPRLMPLHPDIVSAALLRATIP
ncbi:MAG: double-strand break repair helicase AddA [Pseudomonadota bacterium]